MLNMVDIGPGFVVNGSGMGMVEIEPGYGVHGADDVTLVGNGIGAYDDVTLVGTGIGAYDDVTLVGALGQDDRPFFKRPLVYGVAAGFLATAASAYLLGKAMAFK
jgi:hypothetical protein